MSKIKKCHTATNIQKDQKELNSLTAVYLKHVC